MKIGFDNEKYVKLQSDRIKERIERYGGRLYLEFGGKLYDDYHASRVLPGFAPNTKIKMLSELKDQVEIVIVINIDNIEKNKVRGDLGITYDLDVLRLIDAFRNSKLYVGSVVLTRYNGQPACTAFEKKLTALGIRVYRHYSIPGYPYNVPLILSEEGFGINEYIETSRPLIVVTAPGPGSGKMATCLSQMYHENKRGIRSGYAKFETFPIWNLSINHPVNLAYEAATADLADVNMLDNFHLEAYNKTAVNYNRDLASFPVVKTIFEKIMGKCDYLSPTDMGVNMAGFCITDDEIVRKASCDEIVRRYFSVACSRKQGKASDTELEKIELLIQKANYSIQDRKVVPVALAKAEASGDAAAALELDDGRIVTGKTGPLMGAVSSLVLNALKALAGLDDEVHLLNEKILKPIQELKVKYLGNINPRLHMDEVLVALSICAATDSKARKALDKLSFLRGCEAHSSVILSQVDYDMFRRLGVNLTCEPIYPTNKLYHK